MTTRPGSAADGGRPLLAAALIVRDEEHHLAPCLASLERLVDEVVVCDTGSIDSTREIATATGARLIEFEWNDDFSAARNHVIDACQGHQWVISIDADERLECPDPGRVRAALRASTADALDAPLVNLRGDRPSSQSFVRRIFRPATNRFSGRLHERLVDESGRPTQAVPLDGLRFSHVGYDPTSPVYTRNRARNLRIARAQHDGSPTSTLLLARALAENDAAPAEILDLVLPAIADASPDIRFGLLELAADVHLRLGQYAPAAAAARQVLADDPGSDVAGAALARASAALGDYDAVIDLAESFDRSPTAGTRVPANVVVIDAYATAAAARQGLDDMAIVKANALGTASFNTELTVRLLLDALSGCDPVMISRIVTTVAGDDSARLLASILGEAREDTAEPAPSAGISLDLDGMLPAVPPASVIARIAPRRRLLDLSGSAELVELATHAGHQVTAVSSETPLPQPELRVDAVIVRPAALAHLVGQIRSHLDPSGVLIVWDESGARIDETFLSAGYMTESVTDGLHVARPIWDESSLRLDTTNPDTSQRAIVVSEQQLSDDLRLAFRASLPDSIDLTFAQSPPEDGSAVVYVVPHDVMPEPGWVQALWDRVADTGESVGARVVDTSGHVVHAGALDGRPVGTGEPASSALLNVTRHNAELLSPYALAPGHSSSVPTTVGTVAADAVALSLGAPHPAGETPSLREIHPRTVLFVGGSAPGAAHPEVAEPLDKAMARLIENGITPVYQPARHTTTPDEVDQQWRGRGIIVLPPPVQSVERGMVVPDPINPQSTTVIRAFAPEAVVYLSAEAMATEFRGMRGAGSQTQVVYAGLQSIPEAEARADHVIDPSELPDLVDRLETVPESPPAIATIKARRAQSGLTTIVIPVFNRWDLTRACLDSIRKHTPQPHEVVVVDNGSTDATAAALAGSDATVITNAANLGFPRAVNQGIQASTGEFVCVLNNDTQVTSGWLEAMQAALATPGTGLVGPRTNEIGGLQRVPQAPGPDRGKAAHRWAREFTRGRAGRTWVIDRLVGFCLLARRSLFEELGAFDEAFGIGNFEDDELGRRVQASGRTLRVVDDALILHHGSATFTTMGVDYEARMHHAARHLGTVGSPPLARRTAVILGDGEPMAAAVSCVSALLVVDQVLVAERSAPLTTDLTVKALGGGDIEVLAIDWATDHGAGSVMERLAGRSVLVLAAGEKVDVDDWGGARAELDRLDGGMIEVTTSTGTEVRYLPAAADSISLVGGPGDELAESLAII